MFKAVLIAAAFFVIFGPRSFAQYPASSSSPGIELANLREDVRLLSQRVGELQLRLEQLERENNDLRAKAAGAAQSFATLQQMNEAVADLNRSIKSSAAATKAETLQQVSVSIEKLGTQMNAAIDSLKKNAASPRPAVSPVSPVASAAPPVFNDDYPKEGIKYTVQKGDSLASIAKKTGAKMKDILNANKLADSSKIQAGQTLFVPGGK